MKERSSSSFERTSFLLDKMLSIDVIDNSKSSAFFCVMASEKLALKKSISSEYIRE